MFSWHLLAVNERTSSGVGTFSPLPASKVRNLLKGQYSTKPLPEIVRCNQRS